MQLAFQSNLTNVLFGPCHAYLMISSYSLCLAPLPMAPKFLGIPMGSTTFISFFIKDVLLKDFKHVDLLLRMGDIQVIFGSFIQCFFNTHHTFFDAPFLLQSS
jgi:hypothetical protein